MTDREKAVVMAYTGVVMLTGDRLGEFYRYVQEKLNRPVFTHEIAALSDVIKHAAYNDFVALCAANTVEADQEEAAYLKQEREAIQTEMEGGADDEQESG